MPLLPVTRAELQANLKKIGYNDLMDDKKSKKVIVVLIDDGSRANRKTVLNDIASKLNGLNVIARYNPELVGKGGSIVGQVEVGSSDPNQKSDWVIFAKAKKNFGDTRAGVENELILVNKIVNSVKNSESGYITVEFRGGQKRMTVSNVVNAIALGTKPSEKGAKSDVTLISKPRGKEARIPLSIKKENAGNWASNDKYWGPIAGRIIQYALHQGLVTLTKVSSYFKMSKEITVPIKKAEAEVAVFGVDIMRDKGAIIKKTFAESDFEWEDDNQRLVIRVDYIWRNLEDLPDNMKPVLVIRNDAARGGSTGFAGTRPTIVPKSRGLPGNRVSIKLSDVDKPTKSKPKGKK